MYRSICGGKTSTAHAREKHGEQTHEKAMGLSNDERTVGRDAVARHAVFALLDRLVEAELLLLRDTIEHDLVVHGRLDVAARPQVLGAVC